MSSEKIKHQKDEIKQEAVELLASIFIELIDLNKSIKNNKKRKYEKQ